MPTQLLRVGEGAADVGGVSERFESEDGWLFAREEGELEGAALRVGGNPEGGFGAAEGVVVKEFLASGDVDAIEACGAAGSGVGVEGGADLGGFECAGARDGEVGEVDADALVGEHNIAGDGAGSLVGGSPVAFFLCR